MEVIYHNTKSHLLKIDTIGFKTQSIFQSHISPRNVKRSLQIQFLSLQFRKFCTYTEKKSSGAKTIATSAVCDIQKVKWNFAGSLCMLDLYDNTS